MTGDTGTIVTAILMLVGALVFENLTFGYDPNKPVLEDVSVTIQPGETLALVGPPGSGKTTLFTALGGDSAVGHVATVALDSDSRFHWLCRHYDPKKRTPASFAVHDLAVSAGWSVWCGGMLETGIGKAAALATPR